MASIIVPARGGLESTKICVTALAKHTRRPFELIVVDNGSPDRTADFLAGLQDAARFPVKVISNALNLGPSKVRRQGLEAAGGEYLVLLDNDVAVTDGWLDQLVALAESNANIGMVGPISNHAFGATQLAPSASPADLEALDAFASEHRQRHRGRWKTRDKKDTHNCAPTFPSPRPEIRPRVALVWVGKKIDAPSGDGVVEFR